MSSLIDSVGVVLSYFINWLSSLTSALISNPVVQLLFALTIIFTIIAFVKNLLHFCRVMKAEYDYKQYLKNRKG